MKGPLVRRLAVPAGFQPPVHLLFGEIRANALTRADLDDDVAGINQSLDLIHRTRGGAWPTEPVTPDYNYVDAVWHECEFRDGKSFTYVLRDLAGDYLGCAYLYPIGTRTALTDDLDDYDVDVSWWVTPAAYDAGYYPKVYTALQHWLTTSYAFWRAHYSNAELPDLEPCGATLGQYTVEGTIGVSPDRFFDLFRDPTLFAQWFAVPGFTTPADRVRMDPRPGGSVAAVMVNEANNDEVSFSVRFEEFAPPRHAVVSFSDHSEVLTITVEAVGDHHSRCTYHATGVPIPSIDEDKQITSAMHQRLAAALGQAPIAT